MGQGTTLTDATYMTYDAISGDGIIPPPLLSAIHAQNTGE